MTDPLHPLDPTNAADRPLITGEGLMGEGGTLRWTDEWDTYWRNAFESRTYLPADASYERYRSAYRYGHESAARTRDRGWVEVESELAAAWPNYDFRGTAPVDWQSVREAVREGWERARRALQL